MSTRDRLRGKIINFILSEKVENSTELLHRYINLKKEKIHFYYNLGDFHGYLLLTLLQNFKDHCGLEIKIILIPGPKGEFDLVPKLKNEWSFRDSKLLSSFWDLDNNILEKINEKPILSGDDLKLAERVAIQIIKKEKGHNVLKLVKSINDALFTNNISDLKKIQKKYGLVDEQFRVKHLNINQSDQSKKGHYQSGVLFYNGLWYWGIDRFLFLEKRLKKRSLYEGSILKEKKVTFQKEKSLILKSKSKKLDFYFSFRSPYSYISLKRAFDLEKKYDVELNIKPVLPMIMRGLPVPKKKRIYIVKDTARIARSINVPFGKISDPVGKGVENCMALYQHIKDRGKEKEFLLSATTGCWSESLNLANHEDLKKVVSRIGINFDEVKKLLKREDWREMTSKNQKDLENLGLWGVPSFHYKGFSFWGQDRISFLEDIIRFEN